MQPWQLFFAGRCDEGQMAYGWAIVRVDTGELETDGKTIAKTIDGGSADIACYVGLYRALQRLVELREPLGAKYGGVVLGSDNEAVINQVAERWALPVEAGEKMVNGHKRCVELLVAKLAPYSTEVRKPDTNLLARQKCDEAFEHLQRSMRKAG